MTSKRKEPTATGEVTRALTAKDDFMSLDELVAVTGKSRKQVMSALWTLQHYFRAVECVRQGNELWWFVTPQTDTRMVTYDERTPESKPRRRKPRTTTSR